MTKLTVTYPIGPASPIGASPVLADGVQVGSIHATHARSGWNGHSSEYRYYSNDAGAKLGLPKVLDAKTKRELLAMLAEQLKPLRERLCVPMTVGQAAIAAASVV